MKKTVVGIAVALMLAGVHVATALTNPQGQTIVTTTNAYGVVTTTITMANGAATVTNRTVLPQGAQIDAAVWVNSTLFTPRNYGDMLIGVTTGKVWIATGLTTNDWKLLN